MILYPNWDGFWTYLFSFLSFGALLGWFLRGSVSSFYNMATPRSDTFPIQTPFPFQSPIFDLITFLPMIKSLNQFILFNNCFRSDPCPISADGYFGGS